MELPSAAPSFPGRLAADAPRRAAAGPTQPGDRVDTLLAPLGRAGAGEVSRGQEAGAPARIVTRNPLEWRSGGCWVNSGALLSPLAPPRPFYSASEPSPVHSFPTPRYSVPH